MVGQTTAKSGACGMAQCSQRGVTSSETNIARSVSTIFASSASPCYYPSGIEKRKRKEKKKKKNILLHRTDSESLQWGKWKKGKKRGGGRLVRNNRGKDDSRIEILIYNFFLLLLFTYNLDNERDLITRKGFGLISDNY